MNGLVQAESFNVRWYLTFAKPKKRDILVESLRFKVAKSTGDSFPGFPLTRFEYVAREIQRAIEREMTLRYNPKDAPISMQSWRRDPEEVKAWLDELRKDFYHRRDNNKLAGDGDVLSVKDLVAKVGCTTAEIDRLHKRGLIRPKRTVGGQRRFSQLDAERISELIHKLRRGEDLCMEEGFDSETDNLRDSPTNRSETRNMTMDVVAHLYAEASELFPSRDHGVIEYIQSKMEWLTEDHIITMIRLARTRLNLPIYRRGRMPKSLKKTSESKTEE